MTAKPITRAHATGINRIAQLNDEFRRRPLPGAMVATAGVIALAQDALPAVLAVVQEYSAFTPDNNPHGEHDFGTFEWGGARLFWKIDYYDRAMQYGSPDPADPDVTMRILTVMRADEY